MTTQITEYSKTEAAITELKSRWSEVPSAETKEGYAFIKVGLSELRGFRTGLEKMRVELKAPILDRGRLLDSEAKRITEELTSLEAPMIKAKKDVDDREAREKAERLARLKVKIDEILSVPASVKGKQSGDIAEAIERVDSIDATQDYYDLTTDAINARAEVLNELQAMLIERVGFEVEQDRLKEEAEKQAIDRAEIEAAQAEIEEARKIVSEAARLKEEAELRETEAERAAEAAKAAKVKAEQDAIEAAKLAEKQRGEAVEAERARVAAEMEVEAEAAKKREANKRHKAKINNAAVEAIRVALLPCDSGEFKDYAKAIVEAIAKNDVPNISIKY